MLFRSFTPFFLVYGAEAVMPTDIEHDAPRIVLFTEAEAKQAYEDGMDLLEEACQLAVEVGDVPATTAQLPQPARGKKSYHPSSGA